MKRFILILIIFLTLNSARAEDARLKYIPYGVPVVFGLYGAIFWDWGKVHSFRFRNEGWFGKETYSGGADKLSHGYFHFLFDRMSYNFYLKNGFSKDQALKSSFILSSSIGLMIEVGDAFSHYGFSINDLISNMAGIGLAHLLNSDEYLDELIGFQFWFLNDVSETKKNQNFYNQIADYNNQKYILNLRLAAIPMVKENIALKYVNIDLGYYTRGFQVDNPKRRVPFLGLSINFSKLLTDYFPNSDYTYYASSVFKYYQAPYTGVSVLK